MTASPFLSATWIEAVRQLRHELPAPDNLPQVVVNFTVDDAPDDLGGGSVTLHLDSTSGVPELVLDHHDAPDVSVTTDYATARTMLVEGDPGAAMAAFMSGKVLVQGELIKLLTLNGSLATDPRAAEVAERIRSLTA